jgi:pimeloyl-ACP methyl ester carboxylesterase/DNA-binding CsgD family transcriptional regulator
VDQDIRFCTTRDGVRIAYATAGKGPLIVKAPNWLSHLEYELKSPLWRHWWQELTSDYTLLRFDQRGCGLSDWEVADISFEAWVSDLEAVVEEYGARDFALLGMSQGGPVAVEYAARHPENVRSLVLYGSFARGWARRGRSVAEQEALVTLIREGWARADANYHQIFTRSFMPEATPEQMRWFDELQLASTNAENAASIRIASSRIDVVGRLPQLRAPTLVLHPRGDRRVPFEEGRLLAAQIPGARFVQLDGNNHLLIEGEPAWTQLVTAVRDFLGEDRSPQARIPEAAPRPERLTPREVDVLRLIAAGKSNQEIAGELVISFNTVTNHVKRILQKTGSANRTEAANYAFRHRLVASD